MKSWRFCNVYFISDPVFPSTIFFLDKSFFKFKDCQNLSLQSYGQSLLSFFGLDILKGFLHFLWLSLSLTPGSLAWFAISISCGKWLSVMNNFLVVFKLYLKSFSLCEFLKGVCKDLLKKLTSSAFNTDEILLLSECCVLVSMETMTTHFPFFP